MAKKTKKAPAKNFVIETILKSKGRGKNKQTTATAKKERFQKRLYCLPVAPVAGKGKAAKRAKRFECFGNLEDAMAAFAVGMGRGLPVPEPRPPAFSPKNMAEMEKAMKGLRGALPARGLRGTPEEHQERAMALRAYKSRVARALWSPEYQPTDMERAHLLEQYGTLQNLIHENESWMDGEPVLVPGYANTDHVLSRLGVRE